MLPVQQLCQVFAASIYFCNGIKQSPPWATMTPRLQCRMTEKEKRQERLVSRFHQHKKKSQQRSERTAGLLKVTARTGGACSEPLKRHTLSFACFLSLSCAF